MSTKDIVIDLSKYNDNDNNNNDNDNNNDHSIENLENYVHMENNTVSMIESMIPCGSATVQYAPGAPQSPGSCPTTKYSGETVILKATPRDGIGPYTVTFRRGILTSPIPENRLTGTNPHSSTGMNPVYNVTENDDIIRTYTLNDLDISSATSGTLTFSVEVTDSCPTEPQSCTSTCVINVGCYAPVCNFVVT